MTLELVVMMIIKPCYHTGHRGLNPENSCLAFRDFLSKIDLNYVYRYSGWSKDKRPSKTWFLTATCILHVLIPHFQKTMELFVSPVTCFRSKLKFFRTRQAIFIYVTTFYLMFMLLHKPKFVPGAEFSNNKEWFSSWVNLNFLSEKLNLPLG